MQQAAGLVAAGRFAEAAALLAAALDALVGPGGHPYRGGTERAVALEVAALSHDLGAVEWALARFDDAEASLARARAAREAWGVPPGVLADTIERQAALCHYRGQHAAAEAAFREALRLRAAAGDALAEAVTRRNRGALLRDLGDLDRARAELELAEIAIARRAGHKSAEHVAALKALAHLEVMAGTSSWRAERAASLAVKRATRVHGDTHPYVGGALLSLGGAQMAARQFRAAGEALRLGEEILAAGFGAEHPLVACALAQRSALLHVELDYDQAEVLAGRARTIYDRTYAGSAMSASFLEGHAVALTWLERDEEARAILEEALGRVPTRDPAWRAQRASLLRAIHNVCRRLGDDEAAWRWLGAVPPPPAEPADSPGSAESPESPESPKSGDSDPPDDV